MADCPQKIRELVDRFHRNIDQYKSGKYNEAQVRQEFIDPMFKALGWDMDNEEGNAEAYKDVIHEDAIKIGSATKAPDYCFRIGGHRKFFLEAKKPSVHIKEDIDPAYQIRRYAWSAKLPLSVLTDFEEFAVYDCRIKPDKDDKASAARIFYLKYTDYADKWEEIEGIFSKSAVLKGSFDRFAESSKKKKGTAEVDSAFLGEIESWRDIFARNIAMRNETFSQRDLNYAVQATIDRIIFLRICEDRGIEIYGRLMAAANGEGVYSRLLEIFMEADDKYNSGLFHFRKEKGRLESPDELSTSLKIDDKVLRDVIASLYYPDCPYEFSALPADILGQVYEQFLGKVIRLTSGHRAVVEFKPEVKKAGGVFYTPTFIVEYIVKNTVGKLLEGKTPKQATALKICDPACGSGSFLLGAYQCLLDWHRDYYTNNGPEKYKKEMYRAAHGEWRLAIQERKRILLNNIYGVDIDPQAVETTKLSLLLKVLEQETEESLKTNMNLFHERALPDLGNNVKCGNSLIGTDYFEGKLGFLADDDKFSVNPFDWHTAFPQLVIVGKGAGFDAVIGNPPYGYMIPQPQQEYFLKHFHHQNYQQDLYLLFLEKYEELLKQNGLLGIIVSNTWLQSITLRGIRKNLAAKYSWRNILYLPEKVFSAIVDTHVLVFERNNMGIKANKQIQVDIRKNAGIAPFHILPSNIIPTDGEPINITAPKAQQVLFRKIMGSSISLSDVCYVYNGAKPFEKGKGNPPQTDHVMKNKPYVQEGKRPGKEWKPLLRGSLINRHRILWDNDYWIKYGPWLAAPRDPAIFEAPEKIMVRQTGDSVIGAMVPSGFIGRNNLHIIIPKGKAIHINMFLGILNSKLMDFIYSTINPEKGEALAEVKKEHMEMLPIPKKLQSDKSRLLELAVSKIIKLNDATFKTKTPHDRELLQRQIVATDRQIDTLVYELYGLTEEEISLVEGAAEK